METHDIYEKFITWMKNAPPGFPDIEDMVALIKARYTPEDALLLTEMPFDGKAIEALSQLIS